MQSVLQENPAQANPQDEEATPVAQNRLALFEDCAAAIDQMFAQALEADGPKAFDAFLDFMARFNHLSVYNAMLVMVQRPGAAAVGTRKQWENCGRMVRPDAVPLVVLQPFGPVRFLFEVGDTEGKEIPGQKMNAVLADGYMSKVQYDRTARTASDNGVEVVETHNYGDLLAGTAAALKQYPDALAPQSKQAARYRVRLNARHDLPTRFATLAHELGHIYCGHLGADPKGRWPARGRLSHAQKELEAEAVAWLVCKRTTVSPRSREYLSHLATPENIRDVSTYAIFEAANRVESRTSPQR